MMMMRRMIIIMKINKSIANNDKSGDFLLEISERKDSYANDQPKRK